MPAACALRPERPRPPGGPCRAWPVLHTHRKGDPFGPVDVVGRSRTGPDDDVEGLLGPAQGELDTSRRRAPGEDEPQVPVTLRQGDHRSAGGDADLEADHAVDGQGLGLAGHFLQQPGGSDREHHHPRGLGFPARPVEPGTDGVAQNNLFQAYPCPETQRSGAQTADRAGRYLDDHDPSIGSDPQFGMDRAFPQSQGSGRLGHRGRQRGLDQGRLAGGGDIDGLLEEGAIERVGLVEDRQHLEASGHSRASTATSAPTTKLSTRTGSSGPTMARTRLTAADAWMSSSTRMTPWLPERDTGLTTHG